LYLNIEVKFEVNQIPLPGCPNALIQTKQPTWRKTKSSFCDGHFQTALLWKRSAYIPSV